MDSTTIQTMDITSLKAVLGDLRGKILPSRFEKAQQPEPGTIQIGVRTVKGLKWLEFSWNADSPRIVQITSPPRIGSESTLAQQIQHGLSRMTLVEINQKGFERIVEFGLAKRQGDPIERILIIELMGRHSNLLLLDKQSKVITLGRKVRIHQSRVRPIGTGDIYASPPCLKGIEPNSEESFKRWKERLCLIPSNLKKALQDNYQGISPSLALQLAGDEVDPAEELLKSSVLKLSQEQWEKLHKRWCIWIKQIENNNLNISFDGPTPFRVWSTRSTTCPTNEEISLLLGNYYRKNLISRKINHLTKELQNKLFKLKDTENESIKCQKKLLEKISEVTVLKDKADKLLSLPSPNPEQIHEAQVLYKRSGKIRRSIPLVKERINYHNQRLENLLESQVFLEDLNKNNWEENSHRLEILIELKEEIEEFKVTTSKPKNSHKRSTQSKKKTPKPLILVSPSGLEIQVGRNHRQNEWISLRKARSGDIWFHVQECPGSHVVLKASNGLAQDIDIEMAADLAAFFSRAKGNQHVPVVMVSTDHLQRIPGTTPGTVRYRESTVCWGEPSRGIKHINA